MAKRAVVYSYVFSPAAPSPTLNLSAIPGFNILKLFAVLDLTTQAIIYAAGQAGLGFSAYSAGILTLQANLYGCAAQDELMIIYDDGDQTAAASLITLVQAGALVASGNPLPVSLAAQAAGMALDATSESILMALGTTGSTPPTLPGTATGLMGYLRLIATAATIQGQAVSGQAVTGNPVLVGGSDGTDARSILTDALGVQLMGTGKSSSLDITIATVVKNAPGRIAKVSVLVAGSGTGSINDTTNTGSVSTANEVYVIPTTQGIFTLDWPCLAGICVTPGSGQTVSVSYA